MVESVRNNEFYEKSLSLMKVVFNIEKYKDKKVDQDPLGNYFLFLHGLEDEVKDLKEYIACSDCMKKNDIIGKHIDKSVGIWSQLRNTTDWTYISYLISEQIINSNGIYVLDENDFINSYIKLENFFYNEKIKMKKCFRLLNFQCEFDKINLEGNLSIKLIDIRDYNNFPDLRTSFDLYSKYVIEYVYYEDKFFDELPKNDKIIQKKKIDQENRDNVINTVMDCLKLYKKGYIHSGIFYETIFDHILTFGRYSVNYNRSMFFMSTYQLLKQEIIPFKNFWKSLKKKLNSYNELSFALRRFGFALERQRYDDKLIDLVISIESLLLKLSERGEVTHKLSQRLSKILSKNYTKRREIIKDIKNIYTKRGQIMHGKKYKIDDRIVELSENYVRDLLVTYQDNRGNLSHDNFLEKIDIEF